MNLDRDLMPTPSVAQLLDEAAARTGFTRDQIEVLIDCELETQDLLDYITAVMSNRMN